MYGPYTSPYTSRTFNYDREALDRQYRSIVLNDPVVIAQDQEQAEKAKRLARAATKQEIFRLKMYIKTHPADFLKQRKLATLQKKYGRGRVPWNLHPANSTPNVTQTTNYVHPARQAYLDRRDQQYKADRAFFKQRSEQLQAQRAKALRFEKIKLKRALLQKKQWEIIQRKRNIAILKKQGAGFIPAGMIIDD